MKHYVYIIYSEKLNRFYIGETDNFLRRLDEHNVGFFINSYTSKTSDWKLFFLISCENRIQARKVENHIKKMKSRKYIKDLKKYPDISEKLKNVYK